MHQCVSRTSIVHGQTPANAATSTARGGGSSERSTAGRRRDSSRQRRDDVWHDADRFLLEHVGEVLLKLNDGSLDDEIWSKIVLMEGGRRLVKAYLRKTTIIVDGGDDEFDGRTLGFNAFRPADGDTRDAAYNFRAKIGEGVIVKMDAHGNLKAMARGSSPVFIQGYRDGRLSCASERLLRQQGRLTPRTSVESGEEDRVFKIFEMRKFKQALERDGCETSAKQRSMMLRTCVRIALVKDGGVGDLARTPCWFALVNLVALEMLREHVAAASAAASVAASSLPPLLPSAGASGGFGSPADLAQLLLVAMQHQHQQQQQQHRGSLQHSALASSLASVLASSTAPSPAPPPSISTVVAATRRPSRRPLSRVALSSSDDDEHTDDEAIECSGRLSDVTKISDTLSLSSDSPPTPDRLASPLRVSSLAPSTAAVAASVAVAAELPSKVSISTRRMSTRSRDLQQHKTGRPGLEQLVAHFDRTAQQLPPPQLATQHSDRASSGYDSPRELFDSGSWGSGNGEPHDISSSSSSKVASHNSLRQDDTCYLEMETSNGVYTWRDGRSTSISDDEADSLPPPPLSSLLTPAIIRCDVDRQVESRCLQRRAVVHSRAPPRCSTSPPKCCLRAIEVRTPSAMTLATTRRDFCRRVDAAVVSPVVSSVVSTSTRPSSPTTMAAAARAAPSTSFERIFLSANPGESRASPAAPPSHAADRSGGRSRPRPLPPRHVNASDSQLPQNAANASRLARGVIAARSSSALARRAEPTNSAGAAVVARRAGQIGRLFAAAAKQPPSPVVATAFVGCEESRTWQRRF